MAEGGLTRSTRGGERIPKTGKLLLGSRVKLSQSAFLKFVKVWRGRSGTLVEKTPPRRMMMGRWSELRVLMGVQSKSRVR